MSLATACEGELLYNGICLPKEWPPNGPISKVPVDPPYITTPPDQPINIDVGRQLFVDSFLIANAGTHGVRTVHHNPTYHDAVNPVLAPSEPWESRGDPFVEKAFASAFSGGLWWDPAAELYKMWYRCGNGQCLATSHDAISWEKPSLHSSGHQNGTNIVV